MREEERERRGGEEKVEEMARGDRGGGLGVRDSGRHLATDHLTLPNNILITGRRPGVPVGMRQALGDFLGKSVTDNTRKGYERQWANWGAFLLRVGGSDDPFMMSYREEDKAPMVALFLKDQHGRGLRDIYGEGTIYLFDI